MTEALHIAVLMGGWSAERPVSLQSGAGVADQRERRTRRSSSRIKRAAPTVIAL